LNSIDTFDKTLIALKNGGRAPYRQTQSVVIPPPRSLEIQNQLDIVEQSWDEFQSGLFTISQEEPNTVELASAVNYVEKNSPELLEQVDTSVGLFERESTKKLIRVRGFQVGFTIGALLLLLLGGWVTKTSVLNPLQNLAKKAQNIGSGDLKTPIRISNPSEIYHLANALEEMRIQLQTSHMELVSWAETLEMRVEQRTRELDALYNVSRDISSRLDLNQLLDSITEKTRELLECETATLCMLTDDGKTLIIQAHSGPRAAISGTETSSQVGLGIQILTGKEALLCSTGECSGFCSILSPSYRNSHIAAPLWVGERVIGALCVGNSHQRAFPAENNKLLTKLANSAAIAIENARLYAKAERVATLEERQRIAAEIHDGISQTLSFFGLVLDQVVDLIEQGEREAALEKLEKMRTTIDQTTETVRASIANLWDKLPSQLSLQDCLKSLVDGFSKQHSVVVTWCDQLDSQLFIPRRDREQILRVTKEALLNAHNHASAEKIQVELKRNGSEYRLIVQDDGIGFDPQQITPADHDHFGLQIMQARANRIGGRLNIDTSPGEGTQVILSWSNDRS
jgi:two-component system nitrate/nitrite sensor histidine kinase NarX